MLKVEGKAKINLTLDILGKRPDGYHEVAMIMQSLALHDTVTLEKMREGIDLSLNLAWMKPDESNLAWKAAALIQERCGVKGGVRMHLTKRIPVAAGLAGGSADAAAVLRGMDKLYGLGLSDEELCSLGAELGSDIPFCLMGGTMLATGRGEVLTRLADMPETWVVLAKQGAERHPDNALVEEKIIAQDLKAMAPLLCNVLESVTIKKYEVIERYKKLMVEKGALVSMMSGSGPTVFGLAAKKSEALRIAGFMRHATKADVCVTRTSGCGTRFSQNFKRIN